MEKIKKKKNPFFFSINTKNISSHMLKISVISQVHSMSEIADIFNAFGETYLVFTSKKYTASIYYVKDRNE